MKRTPFTGRAAVLAVVVCAVAMSLAYPFREYVAQRQQIAELERQQKVAAAELERLERRKRQLADPNYVKSQARTRLHMCEVGVKCYVVLDEPKGDETTAETPVRARKPWYETLWKSIEAADKGTGKRTSP